VKEIYAGMGQTAKALHDAKNKWFISRTKKLLLPWVRFYYIGVEVVRNKLVCCLIVIIVNIQRTQAEVNTEL
jgi:hypothetical protein